MLKVQRESQRVVGGEQVVDVSPTELAFKVVPDQYSTKQLRLHNRGPKPMPS